MKRSFGTQISMVWYLKGRSGSIICGYVTSYDVYVNCMIENANMVED